MLVVLDKILEGLMWGPKGTVAKRAKALNEEPSSSIRNANFSECLRYHNCTDRSPAYFDDNWVSTALSADIPYHLSFPTMYLDEPWSSNRKELSFAGTNKNVLLSQKKRRRKGTQGKGYLLWNAALLPTWGLGSEGHEPKREEVHIAPAESLIMCSWATLFAFSRIVQIARLSASSVLVNQ